MQAGLVFLVTSLALAAASLLPILYFLAMKRLAPQWRARPLQEPKAWPFVSVVIATYNESLTIQKKLENLYAQGYLGRMELLICDGASKDETIPLIKRFIAAHPEHDITLIEEAERRGKAHALNQTFPRCKGEIVCLTDSDVLLADGALQRGIANFEDKTIGAVTANNAILDAQNFAEALEVAHAGLADDMRAGESHLDSTPVFRGELAFFRTALLRQVKVGSESPLADDSELAVKMRKLGARAVMDSACVILEFGAASMKTRHDLKVRRAAGLNRLLLNNLKIIVSPRKFGWYSLIILANAWLFMMTPILTLVAATLLVVASFLLFGWWTIVGLAGLALISWVSGKVPGLERLHRFAFLYLEGQVTLLTSFAHLRPKTGMWAQISDKREKWADLDAAR